MTSPVWPDPKCWPETERPPREQIDGAIDGCRWCGIAKSKHPAEVHGLGHLHTKIKMPLGYVAPGPELMALRKDARLTQGLPIADFDEPMGRARTHMVRAKCRCGADAVCTPERIEGARCGTCVQADAAAATAEPDYDMRKAR
jgi:hypothetical protein